MTDANEQTAIDFIKQSMYSAKLSRLLATENISVAFSNTAKTASFSPSTRTLTFPYNSTFIDNDIHELFMMHEVSHALHLPHDVVDYVQKMNAEHYMFNVIIDIRDERLIKQRYPSCIKTFEVAYKKLLDGNWFGERVKINAMPFAERLNVYAKLGMKNGHFINFTAQEMEFYDRCMKATTIDECIELALELQIINETNIDDEIMSTMRDMLIDRGVDEQEVDEILRKMLQDALEEKTQQTFDEMFKHNNLGNAEIHTFQSFSKKMVNIIPVKTFTGWVDKHCGQHALILTESVRSSRRDISQSVDSMVRVFESKKAAERYKNIRVSDTGMIDINKAHRYKFDNKIFRKASRLPNSKNHGFYIMVDMSGSMSGIFSNVVDQLVVITEFLRRIQVPYKVVGFGANFQDQTIEDCDDYDNYPLTGLVRPLKDSGLIELMNSDQSTMQHNMSIYGLGNYIGFDLGSTPTMNAVMTAEVDAVEFFDKHNVHKKNVFVITDGNPTDARRNHTNLLILDPLTRKVYHTKTTYGYSPVNMIGRIMSDRHGINFSTLSILSKLSVENTMPFVQSELSMDYKTQWRTKGYFHIMHESTNLPVFFAKASEIDVEPDLTNVKPDASASAVSRAMLRGLKHMKKSRNFLNTLAESFA